MENAIKSLESNKEDTSIIIEELGELYSEYLSIKSYCETLEKRYKNTSILIHILLAIPCGVMTTCGIINYCNGDKNGLNMMWCGLGIYVTSEIVYCGGKFIFKFW